jgi:hypothetical protein
MAWWVELAHQARACTDYAHGLADLTGGLEPLEPAAARWLRDAGRGGHSVGAGRGA